MTPRCQPKPRVFYFLSSYYSGILCCNFMATKWQLFLQASYQYSKGGGEGRANVCASQVSLLNHENKNCPRIPPAHQANNLIVQNRAILSFKTGFYDGEWKRKEKIVMAPGQPSSNVCHSTIQSYIQSTSWRRPLLFPEPWACSSSFSLPLNVNVSSSLNSILMT